MTRVLCGLVLVLWSVAAAQDKTRAWIAQTHIPPLVHAVGAEIRDRNGALLRAYTVDDGTWRLAVSADQVDPLFFDMLLAYEDKRFYEHGGVDFWAATRAVWQAVWHGKVVSGASTITMQVARLLEDGPTGRWDGKLRQMRLAWALETRFSKAQILDLYLGLAPYGGNVEGLRAASLIWLGKEPGRLTPAQAALLVALPQAPESRRPDRHPKAALEARNRVLMRMAGAGVLNADEASRDRLDPAPDGRHPIPRLAPHLADRLVQERNGRHDVTLDRDLQSGLENLVQTYMTGRDPRLSAAVMVAEIESGEVLAAVGSPSYSGGQGLGFVDMTRALRSPGSTLKPLVYGLAFDQGLAHPETLILDMPVTYDGYSPQNFDGVFRGDIPIRRALQLSLNIPVVRVLDRLGPSHLLASLRRSGLQPGLPEGEPGLAIGLGGLGVHLQDMVQLYAMLAAGGQVRRLTYTKPEPQALSEPVLRPETAWQIGKILSEIPPPPMAGPVGKVAYKTGTSYGHRDAWALGWDGQHVAGVWLGRPDGTAVPGAFGGDLAAPLLFEALGRARKGDAPLPAPPPSALIVPHSKLPAPLKRFGKLVHQQELQVVFPPDGARIEHDGLGVPIKLRGGVPPFTILQDGAPAMTGLWRPEAMLPTPERGFVAISVIDARGQSARVFVALE
ncbi:MAG: penicillin-binding protein 1C [Pelagimonas sp.]|jgi:penicillin-binding protein 1C|nr:penicillin-binding protein 1C [Pelagimonas sp.]